MLGQGLIKLVNSGEGAKLSIPTGALGFKTQPFWIYWKFFPWTFKKFLSKSAKGLQLPKLQPFIELFCLFFVLVIHNFYVVYAIYCETCLIVYFSDMIFRI